MKPFLKWVGGKTQLLDEIRKRVPSQYHLYVEPFLGGGAVLLDLMPDMAVVGDASEELRNCWHQVKFYPEIVRGHLDWMEEAHCEQTYYDVRDWDRDKRYRERDPSQRAARFIYLNKAGFNGLWRVNRDGYCNVPDGKRASLATPSLEELVKIGAYLRDHTHPFYAVSDYMQTLHWAKPGVFYYLDPPYAARSETEDFGARKASYNSTCFDEHQHVQLAGFCREIERRGARFLLSNSDTPWTRRLYESAGFQVEVVEARRSVGRRADSRKRVTELLVSP